MRVLVTGAAGFIGYHICNALLARGDAVLGVDNFSPYYDPALKEARAALLGRAPGFALARESIEDLEGFGRAWAGFAPDIVIHLAAQAGVRHSIGHPESYVGPNLIGSSPRIAAIRTPNA